MNYKSILFILSISLFIGCANNAEPVKVIKFETLNTILQGKDDKVKVYNIWATWCPPCVKELPHFNKVAKKYGDKVELVLISLDKPEDIKHVQRFLDRGSYTGTHLLLDEKGSKWLPQIDSTWTGAIPATIVKYNENKTFYEGPISEETLNLAIQQIIDK